MEFRKRDPGAVQFGNFINYYQFHSAAERMELMPAVELWLPTPEETKVNNRPPYLLLDVGCNTGEFTQLLWAYLSGAQRPVYVLAIDIDPMLIERAHELNQHPDHITFGCGDVMAVDDDLFQAQVAAFLGEHGRQQFDAVCCFSITMWIHLNHNDCGLQRFLRQLAGLGELFVVEPQPWSCYRTAQQRMKKSGEVFPLFPQLRWRLDVEQQIQDYLEEELGRRKVYECSPSKWRRRICFYQ